MADPSGDRPITDQQRRAIGDRLADWRDRLLTSPRFRRTAAAFPFTRGVARRRAAALFDLCAGFVYSQVLAACVRLRLFDHLASGPRTAAEVARHCGLTEDAALTLLNAAISLDLVRRRRGGRFGLGSLGAALIDNPGVVAMIKHHDLLYRDLEDPVALLAGTSGATELGRFWGYARSGRPADLDSASVAAYSRLMAASQTMIVDEVTRAYRFSRHRCLMDVGGGEGAFVRGVARRAPELELRLLDLPAVAARATARFEADGLDARATAIAGDFLAGPLPAGADIITLVRILHDHDDSAVRVLLSAARAALPPDGTLLIAEPMADTPGARRMGGAYFGLYLLAMGSGRPRTEAELRTMLEGAGFRRVRAVATDTPLLVRMLVAQP